MTMDGYSIYSKVGNNLRKSKNFKPNLAVPHRKSSILDDFEAIANESVDEMLKNRKLHDSNLVDEYSPSPRRQKIEL